MSLIVVALAQVAFAQAPAQVLPAPTPVVTSPLLLEEVLLAVDSHFPLLLAAEQERQIASGRQLAANGAFDNVLKSRYGHSPEEASYPYNRFDFQLEQATGFGGMSYYSGYRVSNGVFPIYDDKNKTADGGEFRGGIAMPLAKDNAIDRRRANVAQAVIDRQIAEPVIRRQRLDAFRAAGRAYWAWVAAGKRLAITRKLLAIAEDRDRGIAIRVEQGAMAAIERTDNRQTVADRQGRLVTAERRFQEATFNLSLYLRDAVGRPVLVSIDRLPEKLPDFVQFDPARVGEALAVAFQYRPEIERLRLAREKLAVELRWAENQTLPGVNALVNAAQDIGAGSKTLDRTTLELAVAVDLPIQRRDARGRALAAQGQILQVAAQERYAGDQIAAEVRDVLSALEQAYELRTRAEERRNYAAQVEEGERRKFLAGQSTILLLNLRELATFDASLTVVDAEWEYFRALVDYRAVLGLDR
ncbi:MAG: TolC family protein [Gemmataceae bacterium]|nr:TolC family protein [Gemmataceae bacterium]